MTNLDLILILICAGIIAGLVNFFYIYLSLPLKPKAEPALEEDWDMPKLTWKLALLGYAIIGIAGALLTPLINAIIPLKGLKINLADDPLILFGYGIVFGYSTNRILTSISNSILAKIEELLKAKQNEENRNRQLLQAKMNFDMLTDEDDDGTAGVCPNATGWTKAPDYNSSPLKNMAWANNLDKDKFGCTRNSGNKFHAGIDLKADVDTECFALSDGIITDVGFGSDLGKYVALQFEVGGKKYGAGYCHLNDTSVKKGDKVSSGQLIGKTGKTGNVGTDKPHLHLEIHTTKWLTYSSDDERSKASLNPNHYV